MFITRFLSGMVLLALSIVVVVTGGYALGAFTLVLSVLAYFEMARALKINEKRTFMIIGYIGITACYCVMMFLGSGVFMIMCAVVTIIAFLVAYVVTFPKYTDIDTMSAIFSFVYAPLMLSFLPLTRALPEGKYIVWMIYISSWGYDTCAYCVGMLTGKTVGNHKIFPKLSPKKSLEGIIGGVVGAGAIAWLYGHFVVEPYSGFENVSWILVVIACIGALIAQVGDLAASAVKRNRDIKDYSHIIPGHGGILDRFDSMIFTAPMIFCLAELFLKANS